MNKAGNSPKQKSLYRFNCVLIPCLWSQLIW